MLYYIILYCTKAAEGGEKGPSRPRRRGSSLFSFYIAASFQKNTFRAIC